MLASGVNMLFEYGGVFAGLVYGGIYSAMVVLGIHHGMVPVLTQMIADQGFNYVSPLPARPTSARPARPSASGSRPVTRP